MSIDESNNHQDDEIPLLEDVVAPGEIEIKEAEIGIVTEVRDSAESYVPAYDTILLNLRDEIMTQLEEDLRAMVAQAVDRAVEETTSHIGQILHDELDNALEHHIRRLIAQCMEREFGPRERHLADDGSE